jgi:co-chaperonin GroES (HSP10)
MNTSGIHPTEYNVLVKPERVEQKTAGGIIKADSIVDRQQAFETRGVLVAVSPLAFTYEQWPEGTRVPRVGDRVITTKAAGVVVKGEDGEDYRLMKDKDIGAIITDMRARLADLDADIAEANAEAVNG